MNSYQAHMIDLALQYGIPKEIMSYVDDGFLEIVFETPTEKTVNFVIPSLDQRDENGDDTVFTLTWIHPDFNTQFCHIYEDTPGDLPNFYLKKERTNGPTNQIDLITLDDLDAWLAEKRDKR